MTIWKVTAPIGSKVSPKVEHHSKLNTEVGIVVGLIQPKTNSIICATLFPTDSPKWIPEYNPGYRHRCQYSLHSSMYIRKMMQFNFNGQRREKPKPIGSK